MDARETTGVAPNTSFVAGVAAFIGGVLLILAAPIIVARRLFIRRSARIAPAV